MRKEDIRWDLYPFVAAHVHARAYIVRLAMLDRRPKTIDAYARAINDLLHSFVDTPIEQVIEADEGEVLLYLDGLRNQSPKSCAGYGANTIRFLPRSKMMADSTIAQRVVALRLFYDFLIRQQIRKDGRNPLTRGSKGQHGEVPHVGPVRITHPLPRTLSDDDWKKLILYILTHESKRNQAMIILAYDAALRREEVIQLRVDDFDWSQATVNVRADITKNGRERVVPFSGFTELLLRRYLETDRQLLVESFGVEQNGPLFLSESTACPGHPLAVGTLNDVMEALRKPLGLPYLKPHTLRHQRCTILKRAGVALDDIALFAGHKSTETTRIYIHIAPTELGHTIREKGKPFDAFMERAIKEAIQ